MAHRCEEHDRHAVPAGSVVISGTGLGLSIVRRIVEKLSLMSSSAAQKYMLELLEK